MKQNKKKGPVPVGQRARNQASQVKNSEKKTHSDKNPEKEGKKMPLPFEKNQPFQGVFVGQKRKNT